MLSDTLNLSLSLISRIHVMPHSKIIMGHAMGSTLLFSSLYQLSLPSTFPLTLSTASQVFNLIIN